MPLIAFINILVILFVMYGTLDPTDTFTILLNIVLIGVLFYLFANQSITWLLSVLFIGAASLGMSNPITTFNNNITMISMSILSIAVIMAAVAVSKINSDISEKSNKPAELPKSYRQGFDEIKGAILACLAITFVVIGLNNTVVDKIETPDPDAKPRQEGSIMYYVFTGLLAVFNVIYNIFKTVFSYAVNGITYVFNALLMIIGFIFDILLSRIVDTAGIKSFFNNKAGEIFSMLKDGFETIIRGAIYILLPILQILSSVFDMLIGSQYSKLKSIKPQSISNITSLMIIVAISSSNLNLAISQLYNGFKLIQLPRMLNI
jgi:hypothetical protein